MGGNDEVAGDRSRAIAVPTVTDRKAHAGLEILAGVASAVRGNRQGLVGDPAFAKITDGNQGLGLTLSKGDGSANEAGRVRVILVALTGSEQSGLHSLSQK